MSVRIYLFASHILEKRIHIFEYDVFLKSVFFVFYEIIFKRKYNKIRPQKLIWDKLAYVQVVTNCQYSVAQMCTWGECLPSRMGPCVASWVKVSSQHPLPPLRCLLEILDYYFKEGITNYKQVWAYLPFGQSYFGNMYSNYSNTIIFGYTGALWHQLKNSKWA